MARNPAAEGVAGARRENQVREHLRKIHGKLDVDHEMRHNKNIGDYVQGRHDSFEKAVGQLNKETERGEHRPSVGGYSDHKHGGEA